MEPINQIIPWKDVPFRHKFMFRLVMEDKELCKEALEIILGIRIKNISFPEGEKSIETNFSSKGTRLDIYVEDDTGTAYDIEMQVAKRSNERLGKRLRYYQSMLDADALKKNQKYSSLRKSVIIFICCFEPFDSYGYAIYTFRSRADENKNIVLDDGVQKILLNTKYDRENVQKRTKLHDFLDYVENNKPTDDFTNRLQNKVNQIRQDDEKGAIYMGQEQRDWELEELAEERRSIEVALNLVKLGKLSMEEIANVTALELATVKKLAAEMAKEK